MTYDLVRVVEDHDWRAYDALRRALLWDARGKAGYIERHVDEFRPGNHPLLLKMDGQPIGTTRLDERGDGTGAIRLVTIAPELQRQGHGRVLARLVEERAAALGIETLFVNAAPESVGYYLKLGWSAHIWDRSELEGFAMGCVQMRKALSGPWP